MIWLADENIPLASIRILREAGLDVVAVRECYPGQSDEEVLHLAHSNKRGVLTFDRDFGELIFRRRLFCPPAVVYLKFIPQRPEEPAELLLKLLDNEKAVEGYFIVLDRDNFRRRKLP